MSIRQNFPTTPPSLVLDFANSKTLDPRITFSRTTTATRMNELGLIETVSADIPRFDHKYENGVIKSLGLLIEEGETNLCFYGTTIENFAARSSGIKTANATTAPDGTITATRLQGGGTTTPYFDDNSNKQYVAGRTYTFSCFFKANGTDDVYILIYGTNWTGADGTSNVVGHFDLTTGDIIAAAGGAEREPTGGVKIEPYPNGWYRCSITETCTITHNANHQLIRAPGGNADIYAWGYQIEESSFMSSLIPTTTNQTVSRGKEYPTISGTNFTDFYNSNEGTIYVKYNIKGSYATDGFNRIFEVSDGGSANRYTALLRGTNQDIYDSGWNSTLNFNTSLITFGDFYTYIMGYKENDFQRYAIDRNGNIDSNTDTSVTVSSFTPTELNIGYEAVNDNRQLNGHISKLSYYPLRLPNNQLQNLIL